MLLATLVAMNNKQKGKLVGQLIEGEEFYFNGLLNDYFFRYLQILVPRVLIHVFQMQGKGIMCTILKLIENRSMFHGHLTESPKFD